MIAVLCVDDDPAYLEIAKRFLEEQGELAITTALSAPEALKIMETNRFDAVVSDYQMPGMDGIGLLRAVRAKNPYLPFIVFTGKGREEVVIEAFAGGTDFYLQKGDNPEIVFAGLEDTIKKAVKNEADKKKFHISATRYRGLFETSPDGILIVDAESGVITDSNPVLLTLLGYTREDILGKNIWDLGVIKEKLLAEQAAADLKKTGYLRYDNLLLKTKDGRDITVEFDSNSFDAETQKLIQINIRNITERKRAEDALRESELRYRNLFENMQEGFAFCRMLYDTENCPTDFIYLNVNRAFNRISGTSDVVGKPVTEIFPGIREAFPELFVIYGRVALTGNPESFELDFTPSKKWLHISAYSPAKEHFVAVVEDITERKAAEETIRTFNEHLEHEIAERTSDLSDVNLNLMTEIGIRLNAEKQLTKSVGEKEVLLREVHHRVKNNLQIIVSLLNLQSRHITDKTSLSAFRESQSRVKAMALVHEKLYQSSNLAMIDLENYLQFLADNLFQLLGMQGRGITITTNVHDIFLAIDTAVPLGLIINELISNSLKYAFPDGRKGEISVAIQKDGHTLTVLYKDNGVGIPEGFDWRNAQSMGLRLVITLVDQLDGTIELDRSSGTVFTIVVKEKE